MMKNLRLSDQIRFANQTMTALYMKREHSVSLPQAAILHALLQNGPLRQCQIMAETGIDRSTMSDMLRRMKAANLIAMVVLESDARARLVSLTPAGRKALKDADREIDAAEAEFMGLVTRGRRDFRAALNAIVAANVFMPMRARNGK